MNRSLPDPASLRLQGAVDLSALAARAAASPAPAAPPAGTAPAPPAGAAGPVVIDVTEQTFAAEVIERSRTVPVVLDFWASWCAPCRQLSPVLERLAQADGGAWVLAKVDVDANPRLAQAAAVQGIPAVKAVVAGQLVHEFTGALPEAQVRVWLDQVLSMAAGAGPAGADGAAPGPEDEGYEAAERAIDAGDLAAAEAAYRGVLERNPGDPTAQLALARLGLMARAESYDPRDLQRRLQRDPDDLDALLAVADLSLLEGRVQEAFDGLVAAVRRLSGSDRDRVRTHLLGLFEALGPDDPRVPPARKALTAALF